MAGLIGNQYLSSPKNSMRIRCVYLIAEMINRNNSLHGGLSSISDVTEIKYAIDCLNNAIKVYLCIHLLCQNSSNVDFDVE